MHRNELPLEQSDEVNNSNGTVEDEGNPADGRRCKTFYPAVYKWTTRLHEVSAAD